MLAHASGAFTLALLLVACGGGARVGEDTPPPSARGSGLQLDGCLERGGYCGRLEPGGQLSAAAWLDDDRMYLADLEGRIRLLNVETGELRTVLTGLSMPQGLAVLNDRLYVTDMGNVCDLIQEQAERLEANGFVVHPYCTIFPKERYDSDTFMDFLGQVSARVLSYRIGQDGELGNQRVTIDRIITYDRQLSPNGMVTDGEYVYVSIGHAQLEVDPNGFFVKRIEELRDMALRTELMGTIIRIDSSGFFDVYATGLRNTYGISMAPDGTIYGVDNDDRVGLAAGGHREELNAIVQDGFYGFPFYGTNVAPPDAQVIEPLAILNGFGSTATYADEESVYVSYIAVEDDIAGRKVLYVVDRFDYSTMIPVRVYIGEPSYITAILEREGLLYLLDISGEVHVMYPGDIPVMQPRLEEAVMAKVLDSDPVINSVFDVYIYQSSLVYVKNDCEPGNTDLPFSLHVYPVNVDDLPETRRDYQFENLDFGFDEMGWIQGGTCVALHNLPDYDIRCIITGQYASGSEQPGSGVVWTDETCFGE